MDAVRHREGTRSVGRSIPLDPATRYERMRVFLSFYARGLTRNRYASKGTEPAVVLRYIHHLPFVGGSLDEMAFAQRVVSSLRYVRLIGRVSTA